MKHHIVNVSGRLSWPAFYGVWRVGEWEYIQLIVINQVIK